MIPTTSRGERRQVVVSQVDAAVSSVLQMWRLGRGANEPVTTV